MMHCATRQTPLPRTRFPLTIYTFWL